MASSAEPPFYLLVAHTQPPASSSAPLSTIHTHPAIEYHYADDSPRSLLPQHPGEHVLVLNYDPDRATNPHVNSLSPDLAVTSVRVTDAPGAAVADQPAQNTNMYVIETISRPEDNLPEDDEQSAHAVLARFKQRNAILRRALDYPTTNQEPSLAAQPLSLQIANGSGEH